MRRNPVLYGIVPWLNQVDENAAAIGSLEGTSVDSGGRVFFLDPSPPGASPSEAVADALAEVVDDLDRAYRIVAEVNSAPVEREVSVNVETSGQPARSLASYYTATKRCEMLPSYLATAIDPAIRLSAATTAAPCWRGDEVLRTIRGRLFGGRPESEPFVAAEALRAYGEILFARLNQLPSKWERRKAHDELVGLPNRPALVVHRSALVDWALVAKRFDPR